MAFIRDSEVGASWWLQRWTFSGVTMFLYLMTLMILMFTDRCDPLPGLLFYRIRLLTSCKQVKLYEECNFLFTEILSIIGTEGWIFLTIASDQPVL